MGEEAAVMASDTSVWLREDGNPRERDFFVRGPSKAMSTFGQSNSGSIRTIRFKSHWRCP